MSRHRKFDRREVQASFSEVWKLEQIADIPFSDWTGRLRNREFTLPIPFKSLMLMSFLFPQKLSSCIISECNTMGTATYIPITSLLLVIAFTIYRQLFRYSIKHIRGPSGSFLRGKDISRNHKGLLWLIRSSH